MLARDYAILKFVKDNADNSAAYVKFGNTLDSTSTTTEESYSMEVWVLRRGCQLSTVTCTTAPSAATDVVRKTELDAIGGATATPQFLRAGIGSAADANSQLIINGTGANPQLLVRNATDETVWSLTSAHTAGDTNTTTLGVTGGTGITSTPFKVASGIITSFLDATESSSTSTGCVTYAGGVGVAKRLTAANVTCTTAPSAAYRCGEAHRSLRPA